MRNVLIAICDDEPYYAEELHSLVAVCGKEYKTDFIIETYLDIEELVSAIECSLKQYDILFLDVEMPKMTGIEATKRLQEHGYEGIVCFVTSHEQYALQSYNLDAWGYLVKPAQYGEVKRLLNRAVIQLHYLFNEEEARKKYLEVHTQKGTLAINMEQILYVEKRRNQCVFHMIDGEIVCYETLKNVYPKLNQGIFCYTHQGFIVNFDKVKEVLPDVLLLGENWEVPVSRKYQKELKERKRRELMRTKEEL